MTTESYVEPQTTKHELPQYKERVLLLLGGAWRVGWREYTDALGEHWMIVAAPGDEFPAGAMVPWQHLPKVPT